MLETSQRELGNMCACSHLEARSLAATGRESCYYLQVHHSAHRAKVAPHSNGPESLPEMPWWKKRRSDKIWKKNSPKLKVKRRDHWIKEVKFTPERMLQFSKNLHLLLDLWFPLDWTQQLYFKTTSSFVLWDMTTPPISAYNPVICYKITKTYTIFPQIMPESMWKSN